MKRIARRALSLVLCAALAGCGDAKQVVEGTVSLDGTPVADGFVINFDRPIDPNSLTAANITVSNVPGPRQTLYAAGAELLHIFPVSISTHGIALNITVQSYRDQLDFGFIAGANIIPHVQVLCDMLPLEFEALEAAYAPPPNITSAAE